MQTNDPFSISKELSTAEFNDKRLSKRLEKIAERTSRNPSLSFPKISGSDSVLESFYRFLGNPKVTPEKILEPHIQATVQRALKEKRVVVAHDRTEMLFGGKSRQEDLGSTQQDNQGFFAHFCLALARGTLVRPLGVLGFESVFREKGRKIPRESQRKIDPSRESLSWWNAIHRTENLFPLGVKPIHVADREADDFDLFSDLIEQNIRFVIRVKHNRVCQTEACEKTKLYDLLSGSEVICGREINISKRNPNRLPGNTKRNPPRAARKATLKISGQRVNLVRPYIAGSDQKTAELNLVHVYEVNTPEGADPIDWKLYTREPITCEQDVLNIVDDYRARWMIEELNKAVKTGCSYEKRQLESRESLLNALALLIPIAWQLLLLRSVHRQLPDASAECVLTKTQIEVLRGVSKREISDSPTVQEALLAIAALGGHIRNNGSPGWQVLNSGLRDLLLMEIAWVAAKESVTQS